MSATTRNSVSMILGAALMAASASAAPAFAGEASLSQNEIAAQRAIAGTVDTASASVDASPATLARNESLARRVIVDVSAPATARVGAIGQATLTQNEIAAQRAIADAPAPASSRNADAATLSVASTRSPTP
ncbi:MAG TPA: hypothetical protein VGN65_09020 [Casimicrobiaceae bacterium]